MKFMTVKTVDGGLKMSKIAKGADYFGTAIREDDACALMDAYLELGGNTIDTARIYGQTNAADPSAPTRSEGVVGRWLSSRGVRKDVVLITKGAHPDRNCVEKSRISKQVVEEELEKSFSELKVDQVDIYFLHRDNPQMPVGEIMDILDEPVRAGKIRAIGASNWNVERINEANAWALAHGKTPFTISQVQWGLAATTPELWGDPTLAAMDETQFEGYLQNQIPVMAFASQGGGYFSKLFNGQKPREKFMKRYDTPSNRARFTLLKQYCETTGVSPAAVCMAYITGSPVQGSAIVGCSNVEQLRDSMSSADLVLPEELMLAFRRA